MYNNGSFWDGAIISPNGVATQQIEDGNLWSAYNTANGLLITPSFTIAYCSSPNGTLPASACSGPATCTDGIQNQGEEGIDCNGPCPPCINNTCDYIISNNTSCEVQLRWTDNNGSFWDGAVILPYGSATEQIEYGNLWSAYNTADGSLITPSFSIANCSSPNGTLPASACSGQSNCISSIGLNGNIIGYTEVQNNIVSPVQGNNAIVNASSNATFDAGTHISLNPGFTAQYGSVFNAFIDGCDAGNKIEIEEAPVTLRNYPNPFTGQTTIEFVLPEDSPVTLFISDMTGKKVAMLLNNETQTQGTHLLAFDGSNYPAGMYYYTIQAGEYFGTQKMILVK